MSPTSLDSATRVSPLELLLPPPSPKERGADGSFAQHLQSATKPSATETARPRDSAEREQRSAETPGATAPAAAISKKPNRAADDVNSAGEMSSKADSQGEQPPPEETVAAEIRSNVAEEAVAEDETDRGEDSPEDELLLTGLAPVAAELQPSDLPVAEEQVAEETAAEITQIAPDKSGKQTKPAPDNPLATPPATPPELEAVTEGTAGNASEAATADGATAEQLSTAEASMSVSATSPVTQADAVAAVAEEAAADSNKPTRTDAKRTKAKTTASDTELPVTDADSESSASVTEEGTADQLAALETREPKRSRQRGEARSSANGEQQQSLPAVHEAKPTAAPDAAVAMSATPASEASPATTGTPDVALPTPVAAASNTPPSEAGAPQALQRLPQHLLTRSASRGNSGAPPNPAEQARFVTRVAKAFQTAQARGGELQLRLSPAELGSLKLEIKLKDGALSARVEAENVNAKSMLVDNLPVLKERLAEQGIVVEKFDVELMDRHPQGQPDTAQQRERRQTPRGPYSTKAEDSASAPPAPGEVRSPRGDGRLNVTA